MCRSSTISLGFLLLLWIGIFIPVTEYQVSHLATGMAGMLLGDDGEGHDAEALAQAPDASNHAGSSSDADLMDFTLVAGPSQIVLRGEPLGLQRLAKGFASRSLPPQERPPIEIAA